MNPVRHVEAISLWTELDRILGYLEDRLPETMLGIADFSGEPDSLLAAAGRMEQDGGDGEGRWETIEKLAAIFGLSDFEADILLLCAGFAIDERFPAACAGLAAQAAGAPLPSPSFGMAARILPSPHWSVLSRQRPLRYWELIEVGAGPLMHASLTLDERILQYLLDVPASDERLDLRMHPLPEEELLPAEATDEMRLAAQAAAQRWTRSNDRVLLVGSSPADRIAFFRMLCREAGMRPWSLDAADLPDTTEERERLARRLMREAALSPLALLVQTARLDDPQRLAAWLARVDAPVAVDVEAGTPAERLSGVRISLPSMTVAERKALWQNRLGPLAAAMNGSLDAMAHAFEMTGAEISQTAEAIHDRLARLARLDRLDDRSDRLRFEATPENNNPAQVAWQLCRDASRRSLDDLARRSDSLASWEDLILPDGQMGILRQIVAHARHSSVVFGEWGFAGRYTLGHGLSALFSGHSGTGKTMAAGILARELDRDLYQIDLATVVSKYIGETEKHLRRIFDTAERSGAILLFDEADALFGKRSEVRDSRDRYANLEVAYLLQKMESYRGIAILTTNMQKSMDTAFQRRLRFAVQFPFPEAESRERIWRKVFPAQAPTHGLDFPRLAQLNVTGGIIRNIALLAAFLAADEKQPIGMRHVLAAARTEYAKLEKPLTAAESRGWE